MSLCVSAPVAHALPCGATAVIAPVNFPVFAPLPPFLSLVVCAHCSGLALKCDVTKPADVSGLEQAVVRVCAGNTQLSVHAVVNNAGIHRGFAVEFTSMEEYEQVMAVNCFGGIRVTKALLPLLVRSGGRVVNITSSAAFISAPLMSAYNTSKYAFNAFTDALRREMAEFGVSVSNIHPGACAVPRCPCCVPLLFVMFVMVPHGCETPLPASCRCWRWRMCTVLRLVSDCVSMPLWCCPLCFVGCRHH